MRHVLAFGAVLAATAACGGSTSTTTGIGADGSAGGFGAGGQNRGGSGVGGNSVNTGGQATGGLNGGDAGQVCMDSPGGVRAAFTSCAVTSDCTTLTLSACCGGDTVLGIARGHDCSVPQLQCGDLGCAGSPYTTAQDGESTASGGTVEVRCEHSNDAGAGVCETFIAGFCDGRTCGANQICVHPPTAVGGPQPLCVPSLDGGVCPAGTSRQQYCGGSAAGGCVKIYVPPPPVCVDIPRGCGSPLKCSCFPSDVCGGASNVCDDVLGRDLLCQNTAA